MPIVKHLLISILLGTFLLQPWQANAFFWGLSNDLAKVNGKSYSPEGFRHWWREWKEPGMEVPETPDGFIDWMLLSAESKQMQLDQTPTFKKKVEIFLKVRSLMQLRQEEVLDRVIPPPKQLLWAEYIDHYAPQYNLRLLALKDERKMQDVLKQLADGMDLKAVSEKIGVDSRNFMEQTGWLRPEIIPPPVLETIRTLPSGTIGGPIAWKDIRYFLEVLEVKGPSEEDFQKVEKTLVRDYSKRENIRLSAELIERLRQKYQTDVDDDLLQQIGPGEVPKGREDDVVLRVEDLQITAEGFRQLTLRELKKASGPWGGPEFDQMKKQVMENTIQQTLLGLESLARHYEKRPPLQPVYEFYRQNRLIRELEQELVWPEVTVSEEEVRQEYEENLDKFIRYKGIVELAVVETKDAKLAEHLEKRLEAGEDFTTVMEVLSPDGISPQSLPEHALAPEVQKTVSSMIVGQARMVAEKEGQFSFVKLLGRKGQDYHPFEQVMEKISEDLRRQKFQDLRQQLVEQLRQRSDIEVNERVWKRLRKELVRDEEKVAHVSN